MKILLGLPEYLPYTIGGGSVVYQNLVREFKKLGHQVTVVYGYYPTKSWNEKIKYFKKDAVSFYQVPEIPYPRSLPLLKLRMPPRPGVVKELREIIAKEDPDVVFLHGYSFLFIDILASQLSKLKKPYTLIIHGWPVQQKRSNFLVKMAWKIYEIFLLNRVLRKAKKITCVSSFLKNQLAKKFRSKTSVIPNGIDLNQFKNFKSKVNVRKKYNLAFSDLFILSLGRISYIKGFQTIIKKTPYFIKHNVNIKYIIAGEDEGYKKELIKLIEKLNIRSHVEFVGQLNQQEKLHYLDQCDILAVPSLWEGFGLTALEGMALNKLILTTNSKNGIREVLKNYPKQVLINDKSLITSLRNKRKLQTAFPKEIYNWQNIAKKYLALIS